jgi:hypothetical protein
LFETRFCRIVGLKEWLGVKLMSLIICGWWCGLGNHEGEFYGGVESSDSAKEFRRDAEFQFRIMPYAKELY